MTASARAPRLLVLGPLGPPHVSDQVLALAARGFEVEVGGNAPPELRDTVLDDAGVPVHRAPGGARATPWGMARTVRWCRSLIERLRPDLVQAHWLPGFGFAAAAAGARPLALTAWGSDVFRANLRMRLAGRYAVRRADLVMADSSDLLAACVELGADPERSERVQWGVDLSVFSPPGDRRAAKESLGLGGAPVILSPRSLMPVYNIPVILDAFRVVGERFPDARLVLKHMGARRIELPELPHPDRVHIVGAVPYERMADYYRAADVCVSVPSSDGSPRSVWEAMACATPCVVSDLPWVADLVEAGRDAVTVPAGDPAALALAIERLLGDQGLAHRVGAAGRALVARHLDRERQMDRLAELLLHARDAGGRR